MNNVLCIIQARISSTRLPGKVLKPLGSRSVLGQVCNQLSFSKYINNLVVATSTDAADDAIEKWTKLNRVNCFRGSLNDVLDRFYMAAEKFNCNTIVRITADCPLIDPDIVDNVIELYLIQNVDYATNTLPPTYPDGLDVEVFNFKTLKKAWSEAKLKSEREHVTPYFRNNPHIFTHFNLLNETDLSGMRWTLDNTEDYSLLNEIVNALEQKTGYIKMNDVIKFLDDNKELLNLNSFIKRNEGYLKSLADDK